MVSELGEFLQTRRARLSPADVDLPDYGRRRVPGLRREEVAQRAGVSTDYYVRLEQGRSAHVSDQVLDAVSRALDLDPTERAHMYALARPSKRRVRTRKPLRPSLVAIVDNLVDSPALIVDHTLAVLADNSLARLVFRLDDDSRDRARSYFLNPQSRDLFPDWQGGALSLVAELRVQAARHPDDAYLTALIGELSIKSPEFGQMWAKHPVKDKAFGTKVIRHPVVGRVELAYDRLVIADGDDVAYLYVYTAEPGSESAERLGLLVSWGDDPPAVGPGEG